MQVIKTDLDAQITNLEYRKLGLEQTGRLVTRRENEELAEQSKRVVTRWENEGLMGQSERPGNRRANLELSEHSGMVTSMENGNVGEQTGRLVTRHENEGLGGQSGSFMASRECESSEMKVEGNLTEEYSIQVKL